MPPSPLPQRLGHEFRQPSLLTQALTHRSFGATHNERLEFIGDAVLDCVIAVVLYERFPDIPEGDLSRVRANLVNRDTLARIAAALEIGPSLRLGEGEMRSGGAQRPSILADTLEAIFGAILLDGGFDAARAVIERVFAGELAAVDPSAPGKDPKTRLQEWLQARRLPVPEYVVTSVTGEAHVQTFTVECRVERRNLVTTGEGPSRRVAEQSAAAAAFTVLTGGGASHG